MKPMPQSRKPDAAALAVKFHSQGWNCAESVLKALCKAHSLSGVRVRCATPFGLGGGGSGCQCGALAGAQIALGLRFGRSTAAQSKQKAYGKARALHDEFKREFGATCCRILKGRERKECARYAFGAARIASRLIEEG